MHQHIYNAGSGRRYINKYLQLTYNDVTRRKKVEARRAFVSSICAFKRPFAPRLGRFLVDQREAGGVNSKSTLVVSGSISNRERSMRAEQHTANVCDICGNIA